MVYEVSRNERTDGRTDETDFIDPSIFNRGPKRTSNLPSKPCRNVPQSYAEIIRTFALKQAIRIVKCVEITFKKTLKLH